MGLQSNLMGSNQVNSVMNHQLGQIGHQMQGYGQAAMLNGSSNLMGDHNHYKNGPNMGSHQNHISGMHTNINPPYQDMNMLDPLGNDKRTYRKKKTWCMNLKIHVETPELQNRLDEQFEIEIGSNQRLKILHQTILSTVKNIELRELIRRQKMYIYIEGKEPVARKSKSLAEMGVKDGDTLIVTTEMKLPLQEYSDDEDYDDAAGIFNPLGDDDGDDGSNHIPSHRDFGKLGMASPGAFDMGGQNKMGPTSSKQPSLMPHEANRATMPHLASSAKDAGVNKKPDGYP